MLSELSVGVDLRWGFLIKFPLANAPEKQEIRFSVFTDKDITERTRHRDGPDPLSKSFFSLAAENEQLSYTIQFTDVTWGEDISAHMANYISSKTEPIPKWKGLVRKTRRSLLFPISIMLSMLITMWSQTQSQRYILQDVHAKYGHLLQELSAKYGNVYQAADKMTVDQKLNFLLNTSLVGMGIRPEGFLL
jgi:hypothetical protein